MYSNNCKCKVYISTDPFKRKTEVYTGVALSSSVRADCAKWTVFTLERPPMSAIALQAFTVSHAAELGLGRLCFAYWPESEQDKPAEPHLMRLATMLSLPKSLSWPSCRLPGGPRRIYSNLDSLWSQTFLVATFLPSMQYSLPPSRCPYHLDFLRAQVLPKVCGVACLACSGVSWIKI